MKSSRTLQAKPFGFKVLALLLLLSGPAHGMTDSDRTAVKQALLSGAQGRWVAAETAAALAKDPASADVFRWLYYTKEGGAIHFDRISAFIRRNPEWPRQGKLKLLAEKAMPLSTADADIIAWFSEYPPQTADGMKRFLDALLRKGSEEEAKTILRAWWKDASLDSSQQAAFLKTYGNLLNRNANIARFGVLMMREQYTNARAIAQSIGRGYPALAAARIALAIDKGGVDAALAGVPPHLENDPGLLFERLRWRRRNGKDFSAIEILHKMPDASLIPNPEDWWNERHILIRRLIENKQYQSAYLLAAKHGVKEGVPFAEAEFLAGWLALRFLKKPTEAFHHFEALYSNTTTSLSRSRGAYWTGRASAALGSPDIARQWYRTAARHQTTFYGQMAIAELADEYKPPQQVPPEVTLEGKRAFEAQPMVQAARLLRAAGLRDETGAFLDALAEHVDTPEDYRLTAELAEELGRRDNAVKIAKKGLNKNILLMDQCFPTMVANMRNASAEWALVHAVIRQESAFDPRALSPAGARGLMQLMPGTAKETARKNGLTYSLDRLFSDPDYNIRLGSSYLKRVVDQFDGSYALALAGYNGGPARVGKWVEEFGDPRRGEIDLVDWIESIPVGETRNYVQRVLEGVYIYRMKLRDVQKSATAPIHVAVRGPVTPVPEVVRPEKKPTFN